MTAVAVGADRLPVRRLEGAFLAAVAVQLLAVAHVVEHVVDSGCPARRFHLK